MKKENIIFDLKTILLDMEHYMNKKDLLKLLTKLNDFTSDSPSHLIKEILLKIIKKIEDQEFDKEKLKKLETMVVKFLLNNQKEYIDKKNIEEGTIYEYKNNITIYIRKKNTDVNELIKKRFKDNKIISITIDGEKWNSLKNIKEEDIKNSKIVKITFEK